jgi:hypothetical protein
MKHTRIAALLVGGIGSFDAVLRCDLLRGVLLAGAIGFKNVLGLLRRDFAKPAGGQHIVAEISGEAVSRVFGAFVGIGDLFRRASALGVKLAGEKGRSIADVAAEL